jgi:hypothetical protein
VRTSEKIVIGIVVGSVLFALVFFVPFFNQDYWSNKRFYDSMERIIFGSTSYNSTDNTIQLNCTLTKGSNGAKACDLENVRVFNVSGIIVATGTPVPAELALDQPSTIYAHLNATLPAERYSVHLDTRNGSTFVSELVIGGFKDPQEQITVKEISYNSSDYSVFVKCNKIYERTQFYIAIVNKLGTPPAINNYTPALIDLPLNETAFKVNLDSPLPSGQYTLYIITGKGLTIDFNVP